MNATVIAPCGRYRSRGLFVLGTFDRKGHMPRSCCLAYGRHKLSGELVGRNIGSAPRYHRSRQPPLRYQGAKWARSRGRIGRVGCLRIAHRKRNESVDVDLLDTQVLERLGTARRPQILRD
jgi:hypothetical protein